MFKIGEFSTIARVSAVLLRHYDDIGLFQPAHVDSDTNYRYYSIEQLPDLNRILALRELGLSLEQIGQMIGGDISLDEIEGMLKLRKAQIEQTIQSEYGRLRRVASRLKQIQEHGRLPLHEVLRRPLPEQHFLSVRETMPLLREAGWLYYQVSETLLQHPIPDLSYCMAIFHDPAFREEQADFELGYLLTRPQQVNVPLPDARALSVKRLAPVEEALTYVHKGPWSEIHIGFSVIGTYMDAHRLHVSGKSREVYLNLVPPEEDDKLVVEIQIPVAESSPSIR